MVNRVILAGRLVKDAELKTTNSNVSYSTFTIAVDTRVKGEDGERGTLFIDCRVFRDQAENLVKFTRKGSMIAVDGSLYQRNFTRKDQTKGKAVEIIVDSITFLEPKKEEPIEETQFDDGPAVPSANSDNLDGVDFADDELPF